MQNIFQPNGVNAHDANPAFAPIFLVDRSQYPELRSPLQDLLGAFDENRRTDRLIYVPDDLNINEPAEVGWAFVCHQSEDARVKRSLRRLREHRIENLHMPEKTTRELQYLDNVPLAHWLLMNNISKPAMLEPDKVPFYILLAGSPEKIPIDFQIELSKLFAVGRICFSSPTEYELYVNNICEYEVEQTKRRSRETVFFAPQHSADAATERSSNSLISPLCFGDRSDAKDGNSVAQKAGFMATPLIGPQATKSNLQKSLIGNGKKKPPAVLFAAAHGLKVECPNNSQSDVQGALICQGFQFDHDSVQSDYCYSANDVTSAAPGTIAFLLACYSAGTPARSPFSDRQEAQKDFMAMLPQRLLSVGGVLGCIAHFDFMADFWIEPTFDRNGIRIFEECLRLVLTGRPLGSATRCFSSLAEYLAAANFNQTGYKGVPQSIINNLKQEHDHATYDAQRYMIIGDPMVKLRLDLLEPLQGAP